MKPQRLEIAGFGPYGDVEVIEFDKLGGEGLYLITGDTGAGKTTIFDGIVYALYGQTSGHIREGGMLRSQYAKPEQKTYVELTFEYKNKIYHIMRNPEYVRPKARGDGTTKQSAYAQLTMPDGKIITGIKEVGEAIIGLIGLDSVQFTQVGMIAQGDFLKVLLAKTEDRTKIFREIFHTDRYQILQERLREQLNLIHRQIEENEQEMNQIRQQSWLAGEERKPLGEEIKDLTRLLEENKRTIQEYSNQQSVIDEHLKVIHGQLGQWQKYTKEVEEKKLLEEELDKTNQSLEVAAKRQEDVVVLNQKISRLQKKFYQLEKDESLYQELDRGQREKARLEVEIKKLEEGCRARERKIQVLEEEETKRQSRYSGLADIRLDLFVLDEDIKKLEEDLRIVTEWAKAYLALEEEKEALCDQRQRLQEKVEEVASLGEDLASKELLFWNGQAGLLAKKLEDGKPCLVCGSTIHPYPAQYQEEVPSKEDLEQLRKIFNTQKEKLDEISLGIQKRQGQSNERQNQLLEKVRQRVKEATYEDIQEISKKYYYEGKERKGMLEEKRKSYLALSLEKEKLEKESKEALQRIEEEKDKLRLDKEKLIKDSERKGILEESLKNSSQHLAFGTWSQAKSHMEAMKGEIEQGEREIKIIEERYRQLQKKGEILKEKISLLISQMQVYQGEDIKVLEEKENAYRQKRLELEEKIRTISTEVGINENIQRKLREYIKREEGLEERYQMIAPLAMTATGTLKDKPKILLEAYLQMTYFDRIIQKANLRFMQMSRGQYELVRRKEEGNRRSQSGLELDVIDHYSGQTRSIKTLSGGESFQASLSLALGLSDEIQSNYGGVQLDSMFIDEGFGTLDENTLRIALRTLQELGSDGRLVGIISHVSELKERIDKQIYIYKDKEGKSHSQLRLG